MAYISWASSDPSAGIIDSQSVKAADTVGRATRGHDAGKKVIRRKRFAVTDTLGLLITGQQAPRACRPKWPKGTLLGPVSISPSPPDILCSPMPTSPDSWSAGRT
ncbi:hypothetical protein GCM10010402_38750 [Actinomadura luteofluorescens]